MISLLAVLLFLRPVTCAQTPPADAVERLRLARKRRPERFQPREQDLRQCVDALRGVAELRRALALSEWKDCGQDLDLAEAARAQRKAVAEHFVAASAGCCKPKMRLS